MRGEGHNYGINGNTNPGIVTVHKAMRNAELPKMKKPDPTQS
jgi:hypothetical protein